MSRLYEINEKYFSNITTEKQAYLLGIIYADGCIVKQSGNRQLKITLCLQEEDNLATELLADEICPDKRPILSYPPSIKSRGWKKRSVLAISSDELGQDLINLGCNIGKSALGIKFPNIETDLINHFIRGYFDGNGGITVDVVKNRYVRVGTNSIKKPFVDKLRKRCYFCSTDLSFLVDLFSHLPDFKMKTQTRFKRSCHTWSIESQSDVDILQEYLYKNATVFLARKEKKFNMTIKSQAEDTSSEGLETT